MNTQNTLQVNENSAFEVGEINRSAAAVDYVTDLLGELQTIAKVSGLDALSDDIKIVLVKYAGRASQAA